MAGTPASSRSSGGAVSTSWADYVPALTADTLNPNLGATGQALGRFCDLGDLILFWALLRFGGAGVAAGTGPYRVTLPVNAAVGQDPTEMIGSAQYADSSGATRNTGVCILDDSAANVRLLASGTTTFVGAAVPWAWATGDVIYLNGQYQAA